MKGLMQKRNRLLSTALVLGMAGLGSVYAQSPASAPDPELMAFLHALGQPALIGANADHPDAATAYRPVPAFSIDSLNPGKMRLGFDLFHEGRLSIDQSVGCNSCHSGMFGGTDGRQVSTGARGQLGNLNSPTTFNAAFNFRQFWDGRAVTLADQALMPIQNELEMAHQLPAVVEMLKNDPRYASEFAAVYPDGVTVDNMADAIAYFQTVNFIRPSTPFVRHLNGEEDQLSEQALRGWERFEAVGCTSCHNGINLGGNSYQQLGSALDYFVEHRVAGPNDNGVFNRTQRDSDKYVFKVPGLHGVAETAPYFHDGSVATLELAIEEMGEHQLGRRLSQQDIDDIAAFLNSLGGHSMGMAMGNMGMGRGMGMRQGGGMQGGGQGGMQHGGGQGGMQHGGGQGGMQHGGGQGGMQHGGGQGGMASAMSGGMNGGMGGGMRNGMQGGAAAAAPVTETEPASLPADINHEAMYQSALDAVASAADKLTAEMEKVNAGQVAHYDFLQFEHLELIRHARALAHPPSTLSAAEQEVLREQAAEVLAAANALEWTIADFLRAHAMSRVMDSHLAEPEQSALAAQLGDPAQRRAEWQREADRLLSEMREFSVAGQVGQMRAVF